MILDKHMIVLRILDDQNRLTERADQKAISLLSTLGLFMVFFVAHFQSIPLNTLSIILLIIYFISVLLAIIHIVTAITPRIRSDSGHTPQMNDPVAYQTTFFGGIVKFPDLTAYRQSLEVTLRDDASITDAYIQQIYAVAKINDTKYKLVGRAVVLVVMALLTQLSLIAYTFATLSITV